MNTAILLSGGVGRRMGSEIPKQYIRVDGKMLITYTLETLVDSPVIDEIQIVAEHQWREIILMDAKRRGLSTEKIKGFSDPGRNRQASILSGMQGILRRKTANDYEGDSVLIHDAARPLLTKELIAACIAKRKEHDGVMPVLPMKDTVYLSQDGAVVSELLDRSSVFAGQAPEAFHFQKYYQANMALLPEQMDKINGSTEPAIMAGMDIAMISGDENNFKITTKADLDRFCAVLRKTMGD